MAVCRRRGMLLVLLGWSACGLQPLFEARQWPPSGADASAKWVEGVSCGPLGRWAEAKVEGYFRSKLAAEVGEDSAREGFAGIVELAHGLQGKADSATSSRRVMTSLFPDWPPSLRDEKNGLLHWFRMLFASRFPAFSAKLTARATFTFAHWLMGPLAVGDLDDDDAATFGDGRGQVVVVKRCRFLEEAKCASVCVNACMTPTQQFFTEDMGVPCTIAPDYETLTCKFKFGVPPSVDNEINARNVACFAACPANGQYRHDTGHHGASSSSDLKKGSSAEGPSACRDLAKDLERATSDKSRREESSLSESRSLQRSAHHHGEVTNNTSTPR